MCGLPPFVDELIDVFVDDGMIVVGVPRLFTRPLRLNSVEAFELLAAGRAAMELPGADQDGPLARGLAKLATALGEDDTAGVRIDLDRPPLLDRLATAATGTPSCSSSTGARRVMRPPSAASSRARSSPIVASGTSAPTTIAAGTVRTFRVDRVLRAEERRAASSSRPGRRCPRRAPGSTTSRSGAR
jgi:hypothetical protein